MYPETCAYAYIQIYVNTCKYRHDLLQKIALLNYGRLLRKSEIHGTLEGQAGNSVPGNLLPTSGNLSSIHKDFLLISVRPIKII